MPVPNHGEVDEIVEPRNAGLSSEDLGQVEERSPLELHGRPTPSEHLPSNGRALGGEIEHEEIMGVDEIVARVTAASDGLLDEPRL